MSNKWGLAIADPDVAQFITECGLLDGPPLQSAPAPAPAPALALAPKGHRIAIKIECVDLDDLIRGSIALEHAFEGRVTMQTPRQSGHGWFAKGSIKP